MAKTPKFTKHGLALEALAKYFMSVDVNTRILTVSEFEASIEAARGTIQNSIKQLCDVKAITLVSRGQLGTFLVNKDLKVLLKYAGISFLIGVMPLPYSKSYEGLSTGVLQTMENNLNIPVNMAYMRGAQRRVEMILNQRYDFAIVSKFAACNYLQKNDDIEVIIEFDEGSFLSNHVLMFNQPHYTEILDGMRVGIDRDSIDQSSLTIQATQGKDVKFVEVSYNQLINKLVNDEIDAAIWNGDEAKLHLDHFYIHSLNLDHKNNTIATIIIDKSRQELKSLIGSLVNVHEVMDLQRKVMNGELTPSY